MSEYTVVTGETLDEFNAARLPQAEPEADAVSAEKEQEVKKDEPPKIDEETKEDKPKKSGVSERISELTQARKDALAREEAAQRRAEAAEKRAAELEAKLSPPKEVEDPSKPKPADFDNDYEKYTEALTDWKLEQKLKEREEQQARAKVQEGWNSRMAATKAELPDYDDVVKSSQFAVSNEARDAIIESDHGPRLIYRLASDAELAEKFSKMSVRNQLKELGKMEAQLDTPKEEPKKEEVKLSDIKVERKPPPEPITPVKGSKSADSLDEAGDNIPFAQYKRLRQKELARQ